MKAVFLKEIREHAKWAALMLMAMLIAFACGLGTSDVQSRSLVGGVFLLITGSGFPTVGFSLGLLLTLADSSVGRFAFLTHRPTSRTRIFAGKLLAGICLYFLVTSIPLSVAIYWVVTPGHIAAPFAWQMVLPRVADLIGGLMWLSGGMLVGARHARWIGSRLMPAGMALLGSVAAWGFAMNLGESLLISALVMAITLPAAWGAFVAGEDDARQPAIARWAAGLCVFVGLFCALGTLAETTSKLLESFAGVRYTKPYRYYEFGADGQVVIAGTSQAGPELTTDLQGHPLPDASARLTSNIALVNLKNTDLENDSVEQQRPQQVFQRESRYLRDLSYGRSEHWYYVVPRRTVEGFNTDTGRFIGSLGPRGFLPATKFPQPFPEPVYSLDPYPTSDIIATPGTVYRIELLNRTITPIFAAEPGDPVIGTSSQISYSSPDAETRIELILTRSAIHVFRFGTERFQTLLKHTGAEATTLQVCRRFGGGYIFLYQNDRRAGGPWGWADEVDATGQLGKETVLPPLPVRTANSPLWAETPVLLAIPPAAPLGVELWALLHRRSTMIGKLFTAPEGIAATAFWLVMVFATAPLARRTRLSRKAKWAWAILTATLGFPALALLLSVVDRVATVSCPHCNKRRLISGEHCEHCNAPFAPPAMEGIEVFATTAEAQKLLR